MNGRKTDLPALQPGSSQMYEVTFTITGIRRVAVDLVRPTGFSAITVEYLDQAATK
jgi:beta-glucuronidase